MSNPHDHPTALKDLQDSIYREKVLRARSMTQQERWGAGFDLTNEVAERLLGGAMWRIGTENPELGWTEVKRQMTRLRKAQDHGLYTTQAPVTHEG